MDAPNEAGLPRVTGPAPSTPARAPWSVRRTSTIDTIWPEGLEGPMLEQGHARDLLTAGDVGSPVLLAEDRFTAHISTTREIMEISSDPPRPGIEKLAGARAGSQLRAAIADVLPAELERGSPLYLLLDDMAGASLVASWAWSQWDPQWGRKFADGEGATAFRRRMEGVCTGFRPGSPALSGDGPGSRQNHRPVEALDAVEDPFAWHALRPQEGPAARRARRIDVRFGDRILIDAHFQDSATTPSGGRAAVHEYLLSATADRETLTLLSVDADPRILPLDLCPAAILNIGRLVGTPLAELRRTVLSELARTEGCTHLNDMLRSLAEVPQLAAALAGARVR